MNKGLKEKLGMSKLDLEYGEWYRAFDEVVEYLVASPAQELPDWDSAGAYEDGLTVKEAALEFLEELGEAGNAPSGVVEYAASLLWGM